VHFVQCLVLQSLITVELETLLAKGVQKETVCRRLWAHTFYEGINLSLKAFPRIGGTLITRTTLVATDDWKKKRDDLKAKRNSLFDEYLKRPHDFQLASKIKPIDDEIAVCTEKMNQEERSVRSKAT
jgi:hypothetical protein